MNLPPRGVIVRQLPAASDARQARQFMRELVDSMAQMVRPGVALDCSRVRQIDGKFFHLLACCLEEAMKRNGDVRLSGIPGSAKPALESIGFHRLFRFFPSIEDTIESFRRPAEFPAVLVPQQRSADQPSARAA